MKKLFFIFLVFTTVFVSCKKDEDPLIMIASDFTAYMDENPASGKVIGNITAGVNKGNLSFSIISSSPSGAFNIDEKTGVLSVNDEILFDFEKNPVITGKVKIFCDNVEKEVNITVYLNDTKSIIGNDNILGYDIDLTFAKDCLLGEKFHLTTGGTLVSLNLIGKNQTNARVQMALYKDNNGAPGSLVAKSIIGSVSSTGIISLSTESVHLTSGDYWIMAIYDIDAKNTYIKYDGENIVYCHNQSFGTDFPTNASGFLKSSGFDLTYFMVVE